MISAARVGRVGLAAAGCGGIYWLQTREASSSFWERLEQTASAPLARAASRGAARPEVFEIDPARSRLGFRATRVVVNTVPGEVRARARARARSPRRRRPRRLRAEASR